MEILGYFMAIIIGISLGLIGGGGSILAVPVLAYLFGFNEKIATAYSLFVVGLGASIGAFKQYQNKNVDFKTAIVFGIPALIGVWVVRHFVIPELPEVLFKISNLVVTRRMFMFGLFALLMFFTAISMLGKRPKKGGSGDVKYNYPLILLEGILVGGITGFIGAGGGFLIIPALVVLANLEMKKAIGTSLVIISFKSILGFLLGDALFVDFIDWNFLFFFSALTVLGIFLGVFIGRFIKGEVLQKGFGGFVFIMAIFIFIMEFYIKN